MMNHQLNKQKTLLQINTVVNSGSTGRIVEEIGEMAINKGWKSFIAYGRYSNSSKSKLIKIGNKWGILIHGIYTRVFDKHGFGSLRSTIKLINIIKKIEPNIIHLHNLHGYYINIDVLFNYFYTLNIPILWTLHDCWPFTGHCAYFDFANCYKWQQICFKCPQKKEYPASYFLDSSKKNFQRKRNLFNLPKNMTITAVSYWLKDNIEKSFLKKYEIRVIKNGIDINKFNYVSNEDIKAKYSLKDKFIILGVANTWSKRKRLNDFIKLNERLNEDYQIILIGLSKKQIKNLPNNIIGLRKTDSINELVKLYSTADIFVNPSVEETFGLTTIEALSCGTPAVVYNTTACPEVVNHKIGFIVEKGDIKSIINSIKTVKSKGKSFYKEKCRDYVINNFDNKKKYEEYFNLYYEKMNIKLFE